MNSIVQIKNMRKKAQLKTNIYYFIAQWIEKIG